MYKKEQIKRVINNKNIISIFIKGRNDIGLINAEKPNTQNILKILLPIRFPIARSGFFLKTAFKEVTSSGSEVPMAIKVAEMRNLLNPNCSEKKRI